LKEEHDFYSENFISDETEPSDIATEDLEDSDYKNLRIAIDTIDKLKADDENLSKVMAMIDCGGGTDDIVDIVDKLKEENNTLKADASYNYTGHLLMRKIGGF